MWLPDRARLSAPLYKSLAAQLEQDIASGALATGERLPTHRELADHLGVTVGTITRAYAEAAETGLVDATVGRGTFVRGKKAARPRLFDAPPAGGVNLAMNRSSGDAGEALAAALRDISKSRSLRHLTDYAVPAGLPEHRAAGARLLERFGHAVTPDRVLITCGAQSALAVLLSTFTEPGDRVLVEELTYGGILAAAHQAHVTPVGVAIDEAGIRPDALEAACAAARARVLVCVPNHHNPTAVVMPEERRRRIAEIAAALDLLVVEDDVYGFLVRERPPPIAAFHPEGTCLVNGTSKSLAPGLRIGYVAAPLALVDRIAATIRASIWMAPPLMAEIAARWIDDGTAERLANERRADAESRQALAGEILDRFRPSRHPSAFHLWLPLPAPWTAASFAATLRARQVMIAASEAFVAGAGPVPRAVRLSVVAPESKEELARALAVVATALQGLPEAGMGTI